MTATDRLRQAAQQIRDTAQGVPPGMWFHFGQTVAAATPDGRCTCGGGVYGHEPGCGLEPIASADERTAALIALMANPPLAEAVADWLEDIAADKDSGLGCIHPRALDVTNLILGGDQ